MVPTYLRYARCLSDAARPTPASVAAPLLRGSLASSSFAVALVPLLRRRCWGSPRGRDGGGSEWYVALGARSCLIVMFFRGGWSTRLPIECSVLLVGSPLFSASSRYGNGEALGRRRSRSEGDGTGGAQEGARRALPSRRRPFWIGMAPPTRSLEMRGCRPFPPRTETGRAPGSTPCWLESDFYPGGGRYWPGGGARAFTTTPGRPPSSPGSKEERRCPARSPRGRRGQGGARSASARPPRLPPRSPGRDECGAASWVRPEADVAKGGEERHERQWHDRYGRIRAVASG